MTASPRHLVASLAVGVVALLAVPLAARAATTIGQTSSAADPCVGPFLVMQAEVGLTPGYVVPPGGGVITSWSMDDTNSAQMGASVRLKLLRAISGPDYKVVAQDVSRTVTPNGLNTFKSRVPVSPGDVLGLWISGSPFNSVVSCEFATSSNSDILSNSDTSTEPLRGDRVTIASSLSRERLNVAARVEPDGDGDGYGDETQDACPQDPALHTLPCAANQALAARATPARIGLGDVALVRARISDRGPGTSLGASLDLGLGHGLKLIATDASCRLTSVYSCPLGSLAPGRATTRLFVVQGTTVGKHAISLATRQTDVDPNLSNDSGTVTVTVERRAPRRCTVPNLIGLTTGFARRLLDADHCTLGKITRKRAQHGPRGKIIAQSPRHGTLPAGSPISVTVRR